jgi:hypothetical protein
MRRLATQPKFMARTPGRNFRRGGIVVADEQKWVVAPKDARIEIAIGKDANISSDLKAALENLARALEDQQEVQGYTTCLKVEISDDCAMYMSCRGVTS